MDRRMMLKTVAGAAGLALAGSGKVFAQPRTAADSVFVNGPVFTMQSSAPVVEAVAVKNGRIQAVGSRQDIEALCDERTKIIDLGGRSLSPGLIDAHSHLAAFGQMELYFVKVRPPEVHDFRSLGTVLARAAAGIPPGQWIVARGFSEFDEERFPTRTVLDLAVPHHPTLVIHWTGQYGIANTLALKTAGLLSADTRDPYGGKYLRDRRTGIPDGRLLHYPAIYSVYQPTMDEREEIDAVKWGAQRFVEEGVTCVHDNFASVHSSMAYITLERSGQLPLRVRLYPYVPNLELCQTLLTRARRYSGPLVRMQGVKLAVDGYPLMYDVLPQHEPLNIPMHPPDQFQSIVSAIHNEGLQVDIHAAGDRGVDLSLDALSRAAGGDRNVPTRRHRLEHCLFRSKRSGNRMADMGVPMCTQPAWIPVRAADMVRKLGAAQTMGMAPVASYRRAGVQVSFGADVPASPTHLPLDSIVSAMTRRAPGNIRLDPAEKLTFMEALEAHTIAAAYAAFDEQEMGSIEVGKLADLAVWSADLRQVSEQNVQLLDVEATYLAGKRIHPA